jgi:hypothetical protein
LFSRHGDAAHHRVALDNLVTEQGEDTVLAEQAAGVSVPVDARRTALIVGDSLGTIGEGAHLGEAERLVAKE